MEKTSESKSKKAKNGVLVIYSFTGSGWQRISVGGIGVIRIKDNLRTLGTTGEPVVLPNEKQEAESRFFSIRVGARTFNLEFQAGDSLVAFQVGQETKVWTNARLEPPIKG